MAARIVDCSIGEKNVQREERGRHDQHEDASQKAWHRARRCWRRNGHLLAFDCGRPLDLTRKPARSRHVPIGRVNHPRRHNNRHQLELARRLLLITKQAIQHSNPPCSMRQPQCARLARRHSKHPKNENGRFPRVVAIENRRIARAP